MNVLIMDSGKFSVLVSPFIQLRLLLFSNIFQSLNFPIQELEVILDGSILSNLDLDSGVGLFKVIIFSSLLREDRITGAELLLEILNLELVLVGGRLESSVFIDSAIQLDNLVSVGVNLTLFLVNDLLESLDLYSEHTLVAFEGVSLLDQGIVILSESEDSVSELLVLRIQNLDSSLELSDSLSLSLELIDCSLGGGNALSQTTDLASGLLEEVSQLRDILILDSDLDIELLILSSKLR